MKKKLLVCFVALGLMLSGYYLTTLASKGEPSQMSSHLSSKEATKLTVAKKVGESQMKSTSSTQHQEQLQSITERLLIPEGYELRSVLANVEQNGQKVLVFRFVPTGSAGELGGEHYSVTIEEETQKILGFTHMAAEFAIENQPKLLSEEQTKTRVTEFLNDFEPGYFETLENLWIDRHDEKLVVAEQVLTVSGMKYKCFVPTTNDYTWVIVGYNGEIVTMERGIIWEGGRVSEKWLDDDYLGSNGR